MNKQDEISKILKLHGVVYKSIKTPSENLHKFFKVVDENNQIVRAYRIYENYHINGCDDLIELVKLICVELEEEIEMKIENMEGL